MGASTASASTSARERPSALPRSCAARRRSMPYFSRGWARAMSSRSASDPRAPTNSAGSRLSGSVTAASSTFARPASGVMESSMKPSARSAARCPASSPSNRYTILCCAWRAIRRMWRMVSAVPSVATALPMPASCSAMTSV